MLQRSAERGQQMKKDDKNNYYNENIYLKTEERSFYLYIDGKQVWVTKEFYYAYTQLINTEEKRRDDEGRCLIEAQRGELKRCRLNCSECPLKRTGYALSLDHRQEEYGYQAEDEYDLVAEFEYQEKKASLEMELSLLSELDQRILNLYRQDYTEREIAVEVGLSQKAINLRVNKLILLLKEKLSGF